MSGFLALVHLDGTPVEPAVFDRMLARLTYRGPDHQATWIDGQVALGHALYKTNAGDIPQPYTLQQVTIVAHVRIDAREDLIPALRSAGIDAKLDAPDVELLAKAYLAWGEDFLTHLLGDFAFVLWDAQARKLVAARDQFGVLPLFYAQVGGALILSGEISAIRRHPKVSAALNDVFIGDFLTIGNPLFYEKTNTAFADISRLPPAHVLTMKLDDAGTLTTRRYWQLPHDDPMIRYRKESDYIEQFHEVFGRAVKDRMRAGRIVVTLSGGLDSTAIAATAVQLVKSGAVNAELTAFTSVHDRTHPDTEAYFSALAARKLGLKHVIFVTDDYPLALPLGTLAEPQQVYQRGLAHEFTRVTESLGEASLGGYGGDETLWHAYLMDILRAMPLTDAIELFRWEWRFLGHRPPVGGWRRAFRRTNKTQWRGFPFPEWLDPEFERQHHFRQRYIDTHAWEPEHHHRLHPNAYTSITRLDRQLTSEYLEPTGAKHMVAAPFLDVRVNRFVLALPPLPWTEQKYLLRRAYQGMLPRDVLERQKTPLGNLVNSLLQQPGVEWVDQWQAVPELARYVRREAIPPLVTDQRSGSEMVHLRPMLLNDWLGRYRG
ncbi:MAG: hypothetical protein IAE80_26345 [Anaerolinea sp.]|nr:hypothetical protein [Anaerolinea sp.]